MSWDWRTIALALAAAWTLQALLAYRHVLHYRATLRELYASRPRGYLGAGRCRAGWRRGAVAILLADERGTVVGARLLEGASVFARFRPAATWDGRSVRQLAADDPGRRDLPAAERAAIEAARQILQRMEADDEGVVART